MSSVEADSTGSEIRLNEIFDAHPGDDGAGEELEFSGSWSMYSLLKSGVLLVNSVERGVFALSYTGQGMILNPRAMSGIIFP